MPVATTPFPAAAAAAAALPIAILPSPSECVLDPLPLAKHLRHLLPNLHLQSTPTSETRGLIYLPKMTDAEAHVRLRTVLKMYPHIEWVQLPMSGVDAYLDLIRERPDRIWCSGKGTAGALVAEHALALILSLLRRIPQRVAAQSWGPKLGLTLLGKHIVVVGYGAAARAFIELVRPFRCRISVVRRRVGMDRRQDDSDSSDGTSDASGRDGIGGDGDCVAPPTFYHVASLHEALAEADIVVLALALTPSNRRLFGRAELDAMRPGSVLINVSRGQLVDTDALVETVERGRLGGVGIDVVEPEPLPPSHPLWHLMQSGQRHEGGTTPLIVTPHSAVTPQLIEPFLRERISRNARAFVNGADMDGVVDPATGY
ncbi:uncharacterized protein PSFLO_05951 [Pseudozyma flocculosa]|nr:uncharacterized protein PSFLO_05951 [Pseudozyma flocculosa]